MDDLLALFDYLKKVATNTNAERAFVDFTTAEGNVFRIEYKTAKRRK